MYWPPFRAWLTLAGCVLLQACASTPGRGSSLRYSLDSPSATCRHSISGCIALYGKEAASTVAVLRVLDDATRTSIRQALLECADLARSEVLLRHQGEFEGLIPNADECNQPAKNAKRKGVTWAMQLGTEMHEEALKCAEERLGLLRPGGFSLEQRYRYDSRTRRWKRVSPDEEKALHESGNSGELKGTLKPDVVIHSGDPLKAEAIYDYKFPCVNPKEMSRWEKYPEGHPYQNFDQGQMYQKALGPKPARIMPRWGANE
jgi:hypothetical protein